MTALNNPLIVQGIFLMKQKYSLILTTSSPFPMLFTSGSPRCLSCVIPIAVKMWCSVISPWNPALPGAASPTCGLSLSTAFSLLLWPRAFQVLSVTLVFSSFTMAWPAGDFLFFLFVGLCMMYVHTQRCA